MKKFLMMLTVAIFATMSMNAQKALVESKFWDNWYIGINGGATTPLSFDKVTPLNPTVGVRIGKEFTPVFGVNVEGTAWLGSHSDIGKTIVRFDGDRHLVVRGTNLGVNGTVNFSNLFCGSGNPSHPDAHPYTVCSTASICQDQDSSDGRSSGLQQEAYSKCCLHLPCPGTASHVLADRFPVQTSAPEEQHSC